MQTGLATQIRPLTVDAIAEYKKAVALDSGLVLALNNLGNALFDKHQMDEAMAEYYKAIALNPDDAVAHNNLGRALVADKIRLIEAIAEFRKAIQLKPEYALAHWNLAMGLLLTGQTAEAMQEFGKYNGLKKAQGSDSAYRRRSRIRSTSTLSPNINTVASSTQKLQVFHNTVNFTSTPADSYGVWLGDTSLDRNGELLPVRPAMKCPTSRPTTSATCPTC